MYLENGSILQIQIKYKLFIIIILDNKTYFQEKIIKNFEESRELINAFAEINNEKSLLSDLEFVNDKKKLINEIDYLDIIVNTLNNEVEDLMIQIDNFDKILENCSVNQ